MKKRVIVFCDYYLPSLGGGGGMWAVANIVDRLCDRYDFFVVAGNRNAHGNSAKVSGVVENAWNAVGNAQVFYGDTSALDVPRLQGLMTDVRPDLVFLNSFFSTSTIKYLNARRRRAFADIQTIIAPCGELLPGALAIKALKKKLFIAYAKISGLYRGLIWRASFESERECIRDIFGDNIEIRIAADLTPRTILPDFVASEKPAKQPAAVKLVFLSRIVRIKNLHFLLETLQNVRSSRIELEIIGHVEDIRYWAECAALISSLPDNVSVEVIGALDNAGALERLKKAHFFVLPTLSENFGFVCIEALAAACPLIISDRTDWSWVEKAGAGWVIPLEDTTRWETVFTEASNQTQEEFTEMSQKARELAVEWLAKPGLESATAELFQFAIENPSAAHA